MPSTIQIVPKFQHPHVETFVYDNTVFTEENNSAVDDSVKMIAVFRSGKGIAGKLVKKTTLKSFVDTFGKSDPKKYGQPLMMPIASLKSGIASVQCMRVMPDDAAYANSVLSAYFKADVENKMFTVKFKAKSFTGEDAILSADDLAVAANVLDAEDTLDGWTHAPLVTFRAMGPGEYGQNLRWRITSNMDYERDYGKKLFTFEILTTENGLSREAQYVGSLVSPLDLTENIQINDVISGYDEGSYPVDIVVNEDAMEIIYNAYVAFLEAIAAADDTLEIVVPNIDEFDVFFGNEIATSSKPVPYKYYHVLTSADVEVDPGNGDNGRVTPSDGDTEEGGIDTPKTASYAAPIAAGADPTEVLCDISNSAGNELAGGTEGSFAGDEDTVEKAVTAAYIKAFTGEMDKTILSPRRIPCDVLLDANYPFEVKQKLVELSLARNDCLCYIDCGIIPSLSGPNFLTLRTKYRGIFDDRGVSKNPQYYEVRDYHTKKITPVTITHYFAEQLPTHYKEAGKHIPFVKDFATLSGHVKNSLAPSVEMWEEDLKEDLYLERFNYFEAIGENEFARSTQSTAQTANSDLLEEHNMQTLFDIKRILEYDAWKNSYNFTSQDERARFQKIEEAKFSDWKGSKIDTISIRFDVTEFESERSILHCYCVVQFRNITKRTIIEIDVNKRNFLA